MRSKSGLLTAGLFSVVSVVAIAFAAWIRTGLMKESPGSAKMQEVGLAIREGALAYLLKPFRKDDIGPSLNIAVKRFRQIQGQSNEIAALKESIETRKLLERAKGILMDRHGYKEEEAFKKIHFQARNQNKKMREIAQSIITSAELH